MHRIDPIGRNLNINVFNYIAIKNYDYIREITLYAGVHVICYHQTVKTSIQ